MIRRRLLRIVTGRLGEFPAVALLGPRQAGKTTLAMAIAADRPSVYLDLEAPADRARLSDPSLYLAAHEAALVISTKFNGPPISSRSCAG